MSDDLYHEEILEHYKHPSNFGTLDEFDEEAHETNASCGDSFTFQIKIAADQSIKKIAFTGVGCAISTAACSLLTEYLTGKHISEIKKIDIVFMQNLIGAEITATRIKCLTLPPRALQKLVHPISIAAETLKSGGVIIFPTDTVWGIGAWAGSSSGIEKLYRIKNRPGDKPTAMLIKDQHQAKQYGVFSAEASRLAVKYWPGALTVVVAATPAVPQEIRGEKGTVGLRVPDNTDIQALCEVLGGGIVTGSANFSGLPAPKNRQEIDQKLIDATDYLLEGESQGQPASTVVDTTTNPAIILRQGPIKPF
jgi:L-threonylcarbamoyladenylate synthase